MSAFHSLPKPQTAILAVALALLLAASSSATPKSVSLPDVLEELERRGLDLFYTSQLVRPTQTSWPLGNHEEPEKALAVRLAPHDLTFEVGPMGRLFIVPKPGATSFVRGRVVERIAQEPVAGVRILASRTGAQTFTDSAGRFELPGLPIGAVIIEAHEPGFVVAKLPAEVRFGEPTELLVELDVGVLALDEIVVTPSRVSLLRDDPVAGLGLEKDDLFALPHLGDDIFRALTLMPGVAGEEVSARFHIRGGRSDEVLILLDQVELYEPYHLKDYSSSVSIVSPRSLAGVDLLTGGFPAQYGDRMGGVLDMTTRNPAQARTHLGLGLLSAEAARSGNLRDDLWDDTVSWYASARRGFLDLTLDFLGQNEQPRYWDAFGKLDIRPGGRHSFGISVLTSDDTLDFDNLDPDTRERYLTSYGNSYLWGTHQSIVGDKTLVENSVSIGRVDQDRRGEEAELLEEDEGTGFAVSDRRRLDVTAWKQGWHFQRSDRQSWRWGAEVKHLQTSYEYFNSRELDDPLEDIRSEPRTGTRTFAGRFSSDQLGAYAIHRWRPRDQVTLETGLRYDEATLTDDQEVSPRLNLVVSPNASSNLRLSWGHFFQTQRPYELQVADGVTAFDRAERTEQTVIGYERAVSRGAGGDFLVRIEAYDRRVRNPRSRYENIFEPISIYPEVEPDRVLFEPESSHAYGAELFVQGRHKRFDW